jgi:hypothetical protein
MTGNGLTDLDYKNLGKLLELISLVYDSHNNLKKTKYFPVDLRIVGERKNVDQLYARVFLDGTKESVKDRPYYDKHNPPIEEQKELGEMSFEEQSILDSQANVVYFGKFDPETVKTIGANLLILFLINLPILSVACF